MARRPYQKNYPFLCYGGSYANTWQLFGHVHSRPLNTGLNKPRLDMLFSVQYDVGVDNNNFTPISFHQVKEIIEKQVEQVKIANNENFDNPRRSWT